VYDHLEILIEIIFLIKHEKEKIDVFLL